MEDRLNSDDEKDNISKNWDSNNLSDLNDSESNNSKENYWNLDIKAEEKFLIKLIEDSYFYKPDLCPCCNKGLYIIKNIKNQTSSTYFIVNVIIKFVEKKYNYEITLYLKYAKIYPLAYFLKY